MRRRVGAASAVGVLVIALVGAVAFAGGGSSTSSSTTTLFTTTTLASVAGQPCVGITDPLPAGAPQLTIPTGPPPTTLQTTDIKVGDGAVVTAGQSIKANY